MIAISTRWKPGHVVRHDSLTGTFEEVNSPLNSGAEVFAQHALLARQRERDNSPWYWLAACVLGFLVLTAPWWFPK